MPTYQYACTECGEPLEAVQSFTDAALTVCPACGGRLRKVFSSVGVVFKGSGFYRTDSRESGKKAAAKSGAEDGSTGTGSNGSEPSGSKSESTTGTSTDSSGASPSTSAPAKATTSASSS
ncbi:MAG: FmdB family zinc ribbon protein [Candidatus Nanopelagicales bacterium]